jgi:hypothetical protein
MPGLEKDLGQHPRTRANVRYNRVLRQRAMLTQKRNDPMGEAWPIGKIRFYPARKSLSM